MNLSSPALGLDVFKWPEFEAFAKRLGIPLDGAIARLNIYMGCDRQVTFDMEGQCYDQKDEPEPKGRRIGLFLDKTTARRILYAVDDGPYALRFNCDDYTVDRYQCVGLSGHWENCRKIDPKMAYEALTRNFTEEWPVGTDALDRFLQNDADPIGDIK